MGQERERTNSDDFMIWTGKSRAICVRRNKIASQHCQKLEQDVALNIAWYCSSMFTANTRSMQDLTLHTSRNTNTPTNTILLKDPTIRNALMNTSLLEPFRRNINPRRSNRLL
jgi:dihydroxyacid dehydratase/phosphogluconate dehydratase